MNLPNDYVIHYKNCKNKNKKSGALTYSGNNLQLKFQSQMWF